MDVSGEVRVFFFFFPSILLCSSLCGLFMCSEAAAKVMVELLGSYTEDNASQARVDAHRYVFKLSLF